MYKGYSTKKIGLEFTLASERFIAEGLLIRHMVSQNTNPGPVSSIGVHANTNAAA